MNIDFTEEEYRSLVDMITLADYMLHAHKIDKDDNQYKQLRRKILSFYKKMNATDLIEYSAKDNDYYETKRYEIEIEKKFILPHEKGYFFETLVESLSERDLVEEIGEEAFEEMDLNERMQKTAAIKELYENELDIFGVENLKIVQDISDIN